MVDMLGIGETRGEQLPNAQHAPAREVLQLGRQLRQGSAQNHVLSKAYHVRSARVNSRSSRSITWMLWLATRCRCKGAWARTSSLYLDWIIRSRTSGSAEMMMDREQSPIQAENIQVTGHLAIPGPHGIRHSLWLSFTSRSKLPFNPPTFDASSADPFSASWISCLRVPSPVS